MHPWHAVPPQLPNLLSGVFHPQLARAGVIVGELLKSAVQRGWDFCPAHRGEPAYLASTQDRQDPGNNWHGDTGLLRPVYEFKEVLVVVKKLSDEEVRTLFHLEFGILQIGGKVHGMCSIKSEA